MQLHLIVEDGNHHCSCLVSCWTSATILDVLDGNYCLTTEVRSQSRQHFEPIDSDLNGWPAGHHVIPASWVAIQQLLRSQLF